MFIYYFPPPEAHVAPPQVASRNVRAAPAPVQPEAVVSVRAGPLDASRPPSLAATEG